MDDPLLVPTLADLRRRRGLKWRLYGDDVLPLWVAEMDVLPPEPVTRAVTAAMAECFARWSGWSDDWRQAAE